MEFLRTLSGFKKRKIRCPVFTSSINIALGVFTSWSYRGRKKNVLKSVVYVQSCCFAHKTNSFVCRCRRCFRRGYLSSVLLRSKHAMWHCSQLARFIRFPLDFIRVGASFFTSQFSRKCMQNVIHILISMTLQNFSQDPKLCKILLK